MIERDIRDPQQIAERMEELKKLHPGMTICERADIALNPSIRLYNSSNNGNAKEHGKQ